jgi:hypothetical protein
MIHLPQDGGGESQDFRVTLGRSGSGLSAAGTFAGAAVHVSSRETIDNPSK